MVLPSDAWLARRRCSHAMPAGPALARRTSCMAAVAACAVSLGLRAGGMGIGPPVLDLRCGIQRFDSAGFMACCLWCVVVDSGQGQERGGVLGGGWWLALRHYI